MGKYSFEFLLPSNNNGFYVQKNEKQIFIFRQGFDNCDTFLKSLSLGPNEGLYFIIWTLQ